MEQLREMVALRRLSAAPLPWPYETHPRGLPPSLPATPVVLPPRRRGPCSFRENGTLLSLSFGPFPLSSSSSSSYSLPYVTPASRVSSLSRSLAPSLSRLLRFFRFFFGRFWDSRAGFLSVRHPPPTCLPVLLNFPLKIILRTNVRPGNCTPSCQ